MKVLLNKIFQNRKFKRWFDYLVVMTRKEIKIKYKNAFLGGIWIFLSPILQMLVMGLIFQFFVPVEVNNYFLFLFTGLLPWSFFSSSILQSTPAIINSRDLIKKTSENREVIVLSVVAANMFHFLISFFLLILFLFIRQLIISKSLSIIFIYLLKLVCLIPYLLVLLFLTVGVSLIISTLSVKIRDLSFIVSFIIPLVFYITPVIYPLNSLPESINRVVLINPLTPIVEAFRNILLYEKLFNVIFPSSVLIYFLLVILLLVLSFSFFKKESKDFADLV